MHAPTQHSDSSELQWTMTCGSSAVSGNSADNEHVVNTELSEKKHDKYLWICWITES